MSGPRSQPRTLSQLGFEQGVVANPLEKSGKLENGPEGHDTPESMQHYSKDDEQADMRSCSQGDQSEHREGHGASKHQVQSDFKRNGNTVRSSTKRDQGLSSPNRF